IPRNLRLMYVHAVQSYVWNMAASERIRRYGLRVVRGDLVAAASSSSRGGGAAGSSGGGGGGVGGDKVVHVRRVETDEEAAARTAEDGVEGVVLPLPGHGVEYPSSGIEDVYADAMRRFGLDPLDMRRKNKETSLAGDYRRLVQKPSNVSWRTLRYTDPNTPLTLTDLDRVRSAAEPVSEPDGRYLGLVCEFGLPASSYATMALREVLHVDTSAGFQTELSAAAAATAAASGTGAGAGAEGAEGAEAEE
ncbi:multisubstrate pseudouridine synthase 7, partial [Cladochytrium tenue]